MRRLIAYIITALSMLLAIGVAATPVITKLNFGREYTSGRDYREIVFNIEDSENADANKTKAQTVADEMRARLNNYNVEDYSVKIQGDDTISVALDLNSDEFNYAAKYLTFSGRSFALVSTKGDESIRNGEDIFKYDDIKIEYKGDAKVPVIILPVTDAGKSYVKDLVNEFSSDSGNSKAKTRAEGDEAESSNYLYLWANFDEERGEGLESLEKDPVSREKVLMAFNADSIWYEDSKEEETELFYVCARADKDNQNQLDISGLKDDNARANYLVSMLKASKYDFEISSPTANISETSMTVDYYANARVLKASAEPLITLGNNVNIKMSKTFIAVAIAVIIVSLLLIVYYRLSALAMIVTALGTSFITLVSFSSMFVLFNTPALIGFLILTAGALFGEILYVNRFKEEVYKGRSIKKANQEASKKSNLITLDSAIILAFSGLMMYALGGTALKPMGVVLFFGAVFTIIMNLLVFKLLMYLLTNSTNLQSKYNVFNIDGEKVPNIMSTEEKPSYESPYEKVNFTKKKGIFGIIFGVLFAASLTCIIVFGATSANKSPLNVEKATSDTTVVYTEIERKGETPQAVKDASTFVKYVLKDTDYANTKGIEKQIDVKEVSRYVYENEEDKRTESYYYFTLNIDKALSEEERYNLQTKLNENLDDAIVDRDEDKTFTVVKNSKELVYTPSQGYVALATGIAIVGVALYFAFRFRPSRGIATLVTVTGATTIAYGVMVGLHFIGTTALTSVAMPLVAVTMMLASLFYLSTEKAMLKEGHLELNHETRKEIMVKAISKAAAPLFVFMLVTLYIIINFFGFGVENSAMLFASAIIGEVVALVALLTIIGPLGSALEKLLGKIHFRRPKWFTRAKPKQVAKRNSSEPEETIFIGIND